MKTSVLLHRAAAIAAGGVVLCVAGASGAFVQEGVRTADPESASTEVKGTVNADGTISLDISSIQAMMRGGGAPAADDDDGLQPFDKVSKGYRKVVSTADGSSSLYSIWVNDKEQKMLAELPRGFERQKHFFAMTVAAGDLFAGLQQGDMYVYWKRYGNRLALMSPQIETRSTGDRESKESVERLFTDRVIIDIPILANGPSGQPVIDMSGLLVGNARTFFGGQANGANTRLVEITKAKAFPENVELAFEFPVAGGQLRAFHYSISVIPENTGYRPRVADERVGYFTTSYRDLGQFDDEEKWIRYVNRWNLEKAEPSLSMSPPKEPIIFYLDQAIPVRYRRFVRQGVEVWNQAFEKVGIVDAVQVLQQDASTGAHMDKDPEDRRYNFVRWLSNDIGTAIGPSRVDPRTGQILDADVVLTDGWIRAFWFRFNELMPQLAMEGMSPETLSWLNQHPSWDPRVRLAAPEDRDYMLAQRARRGVLPYGGHAAAAADPTMIGDDDYDGLMGRTSQTNGLCTLAMGKALDMTLMRMQFEIANSLLDPDDDDDAKKLPPEVVEMLKERIAAGDLPAGMVPAEALAALDADDDEDDPSDATEGDKPKPEPEEKGDVLDGIPEWFIGPALRELVAHEVGHTLGLRHNFAGSSIYTMDQINSEDVKGKQPWSTTVMDYNGTNIRIDSGDEQGDYSVINIGPYDYWAIEYGYAPNDKAAKKVLERSGERELLFLTDEDTWDCDPRARRYDMGADPINFAKEQVALAQELRDQLLTDFVKEGESWARARRGYTITLGLQTRSMSMMANWLGGAYTSKARKGDNTDEKPVVPVDARTQREALNFIIDQSFYDDAYGLTPELLQHLTLDKWFDEGGINSLYEDRSFPVHDRILGIQASALTMILNPTTLKRVYDNEFQSEDESLTLSEMMDTIKSAAWSEIEESPSGKYTAQSPMVSSLRRNLQREHIERLIDLSLPGTGFGAAYKPISNLALMQLRDLKEEIGATLEKGKKGLDPYTRAHLTEAQIRIGKALDAQYIYNTNDIAGTPGTILFPFSQD